LDDLKKNPKHRKKASKNAKWLKEIEDNED